MTAVKTDLVNLHPTQTTEIAKLIHAVGFAEGNSSPAYAATITPDLSLDKSEFSIVNVGTLTGNITIGAPVGAQLYQRLLFIFAQDATGSRTITWNAIFKASANGAGGASTKGATEFVYDGTNWVQIGGPLAFA